MVALLRPFVAVALCLPACIDEPSYEGRLCDPDGTCPNGLVCNDDQRCVPEDVLDAAVIEPREAGVFPDAAVLRDAAVSLDTGVRDVGGPRDLGVADGGSCVTEICNGRDDDCDSVQDNSCPTGQVYYEINPTTTSISGSNGQNAWVASQGCPTGQVVIGVYGAAGAYVDRVGEHCGIPTVREDRSQIPYRYNVEIVPGTTTGARGGTGGLAFDLYCPGNQVVTSIRGRAGSVVDYLTIACSSFDIVGNSPITGFAVDEMGNRAETGLGAGGPGGGPFVLDCPLGFAVGRLIGSDGIYDDGMMGTYGLVAGVGAWCTRLGVEVR